MEARLHDIANAVNGGGGRAQSNQLLDELGWLLSGCLAGWYQGFLLPSLLALLLIYMKTRPVYIEKYVACIFLQYVFVTL
jgi:hypothetical protein